MIPIVLTGSKTIELQSSVATANSILYEFNYADTDGATFIEDSVQGGNVNSSFFVAVPAPPTGFRRIVRSWNVYNASGGNVTIAMRINGVLQFSQLRGAGERIQDGVSYLATGAQNTSGTAGTNAVSFVNITNPQTISIGSKSLTYPNTPNRGWTTGSRVVLASLANVNNRMEGTVTGTPTATAATVQVDYVSGSGTFSDFRLSITTDSRVLVQDIRTGVAMVSNGTLTIDSIANGAFNDYEIYTTGFTGGATENNLIDIINANAGNYYYIAISRDATAGTKTINFAGAGRTYNRSYGTGALPIGVNEKWIFLVHARSATEFDVISQKV
jgi:hypothetical protein